MSDTSPARLAELHAGAPASNLVEQLSIDFAVLMQATLPDLGAGAIEQMHAGAALGVTQRMALAGNLIAARFGEAGLEKTRTHRSDTVRGWACYAIAALPDLTLEKRVALIRPLADDPHFAPREWGWLALRPHFIAELDQAIAILAPWTREESEFLRRFASEALRPRGVWCAYISALRKNPSLGLPLLEPLCADPSRYVQDSVANWLNDASKDAPDWVREVTSRWLVESPCPATQRIVTRALRTLRSGR